MQFEIPSDHYWSMILDELVDIDEERLLALDILIRQKERVAKAYNKKVKFKAFVTGDLVWKVILPMDKKDRALGKWSPNWEGPFKILQVFSNGAYEVEELSADNRILRINGKYLKRLPCSPPSGLIALHRADTECSKRNENILPKHTRAHNKSQVKKVSDLVVSATCHQVEMSRKRR